MKRIISLFEEKDHALLYSRFRPTYPQSVPKKVVKYCQDKMKLDQTEKMNHMLDIGCGNGQSTFLFSDYFNTITAIDPSHEQINLAKKANNYNHITFRTGIAENIEIEKNSVDVLTCGQAAHWVNLESFFKECTRVIVPGGVIALFGYGIPKIYCDETTSDINHEIGDLFNLFYKKCLWHEKRHEVEVKYANIFESIPYKTKSRDDTMFIHRVWTLAELKGYIKSWSGYQALVKNNEDDVLNKLFLDLHNALADVDAKIQIKWEIFLLLSQCN